MNMRLVCHFRSLVMGLAITVASAGLGVAAMWQSVANAAEEDLLRAEHPQEYIVKQGDTLWDISARFLNEPWRWPELWQANPQIANPHLIFPGDRLTLTWIEGRPALALERGATYQRLSPQIREELLEWAIPTIVPDVIRPFLTHSLVMQADEFELLPYIVSFAEGNMLAGSNQDAYARGVEYDENAYQVVRKGDPVVSPRFPGMVLGYQVVDVGEARIETLGDPATLKLTRASREVRVGDRLVEQWEADRETMLFYPRSPRFDIEGRIVAVFDGVSRIGRDHIVLLDVGEGDGLHPGDVLAVQQRGRTIKDPVTGANVQLPDVDAGLVMVFRTFDKVSYALVMSSYRQMHLHDKVVRP